MRKLIIISHTEHQIHPEFGLVGWGPTIREINFLAQYWDEVVHVGCLKKTIPLGSSLPYLPANIRFVPIPTFGGVHWWQKLDVFLKAPKILYTVNKALEGASEVQLRLPTSMGIYLMPYFKWLAGKTFNFWVKYANNWGKPSSAASYRWQQHRLADNWLNCPVTINGKWPLQPIHCKTFDNPCLSMMDYEDGAKAVQNKKMGLPFNFIFIGRIDETKGIDLLIGSIKKWPKDCISMFHIVGEGPMLEFLKDELGKFQIRFTSHGFITQEAIFRLLRDCHFLVLPSKSEGFPKVVAEGLNFGCLPIVTEVGSIPHYINHGENGIMINNPSVEGLTSAIAMSFDLTPEKQQKMMWEGRKLAKQFTFEAYFELLKKEVLNVS